MKKAVVILSLLMACAVGAFAQAAVNEVTLTMVDGVEANISLFKDWKSVSSFMKEHNPAVGKSKGDWLLSPANFIAKAETDAGNLVNKDYKETDSNIVQLICTTLKENDCEYGIGYVDLGDEYVRYVLDYKKSKLRVNRYSYYKDTNKKYQQFVQKSLD